MNKTLQNTIRQNFLLHEKDLSSYACFEKDAIRLEEEDFTNDFRSSYFHDADRILHAMSYTRYMNKTQVFSFQENDHVSKRMVHVQLVSKIARTLARALKLNEDLTEAIALGHDIGHTPLGHVGEAILNEISQKELGEYFGHNFQSVRTYLYLERHGLGLNLTVQVLDGIMCHNGEMLSRHYEPKKKTKEDFLQEFQDGYTNLETFCKVCPMTLEGCVVRISDLIGYLGRDIEDAIKVGVLKREDIPESISSVLGNTNRDIVNTIICDIIEHSYEKPYIEMSEEVFQAMQALKKFNYQFIYEKANTKEMIQTYKEQLLFLYQVYLEDLKKENRTSEIYQVFLDYKDKKYTDHQRKERIVLDFLSGMTDDYFKECYEKRKQKN